MRGRKQLDSIIIIYHTTCSDTFLPGRGQKHHDYIPYCIFPFSSDTLLPERGRKPSSISSSCSHSTRSDTLLPVRGRKRNHQCVNIQNLLLFRYLAPREGTETRSRRPRKWLLPRVQIPCSPRGDENILERDQTQGLKSDTLSPVRGRKHSFA